VSFLWTKFGKKKMHVDPEASEKKIKAYRDSFGTHDAYIDDFCAQEGVGDMYGGIAACKEANRTPPPL
jgi:hypothetical protein